MYRQKIGIDVTACGEAVREKLQIIKNVGFDAVSPSWHSEAALAEFKEISEGLGLEIQYVHAPFGKAADLWSREESVCAPARKELFEVIDACARLCIPIVVAHVWIGFNYHFDKNNLYYGNFEEIVQHAAKNNVKIAFENTEGIEYLMALMAHFDGNDTVGFCWDSGHEMCYNHSADLLDVFGDRLLVTHLNDNLGISRFDGEIFWTDDLHLLPFDGIGDWDYNIQRLRMSRHQTILSFELNVASKPNRHENDIYGKMSPEEYYTEAYKRACKIAYKYSK